MSEMTLRDLADATELCRQLVRQHPNKSELSEMVGMSYPRLTYFAKGDAAIIRADDLLKLLNHFGFRMTIMPPEAPPPPVFPPDGWRVHPQNPAYYYKGQDVLKKAQLEQLAAEDAEREAQLRDWEKAKAEVREIAKSMAAE